jgi:hypothetical protein
MPRGAAPGERRGGRAKGTLNKRTTEALLKAAQTIDAAREGRIELGKDVLDRMMKLAEGAASVHRPWTQADVDAGRAAAVGGDWDRFGLWFDRTVFCAKELAKYQSPTFKAIAVQVTPDVSRDRLPPPSDPKVVNIDDPEALQRVYKLRIAGVR